MDAGTGRDVHTVIVDGKVLVEGGRVSRVDEAQTLARAREATRHYWEQVPRWRWDGASADRIIPPAFPIRRATTPG